MSITVQFFASLREQLGKQKTTLEYTKPVTVLDVWSLVSDEVEMPNNTLCAINMEYVKPDTLAENGDEVAFFPPVTGGQ